MFSKLPAVLNNDLLKKKTEHNSFCPGNQTLIAAAPNSEKGPSMPKKTQEKFLYEIWKNQKFEHGIATLEDEKIEILDQGVENIDLGGPDFINARIKIGNITYVGDVEIDSYHTDWKRHGHNLNNRFNKVIIHVVLRNDSNQQCVYTHDGRKVPTILFSDFIGKSYAEEIKKAINAERDSRLNKMPCHQASISVDSNSKIDFLAKLGINRFKKKCDRMLTRLKEIEYVRELRIDEPAVKFFPNSNFNEEKIPIKALEKTEPWEQLLYECVFEALGYSQNKNIMLKLAQAVDIQYLKQFKDRDDFIQLAEAIYFNVGGLFPNFEETELEDTSEYLRLLHEKWIEVADTYDGEFFDESKWNYHRLRPQNFPTIRIAAGALIVNDILNNNLIHKIIRKVTEIHNINVLKNSVRSLFITKSDGYWSRHYVFDKGNNTHIKYFIGANRADEIYLNVLLPFVLIYFEVFKKDNLTKKVLRMYRELKVDIDNGLVRSISEGLQLSDSYRKLVIYQGMIELFRNYCSRNKCEECLIGAMAFDYEAELQ